MGEAEKRHEQLLDNKTLDGHGPLLFWKGALINSIQLDCDDFSVITMFFYFVHEQRKRHLSFKILSLWLDHPTTLDNFLFPPTQTLFSLMENIWDGREELSTFTHSSLHKPV